MRQYDYNFNALFCVWKYTFSFALNPVTARNKVLVFLLGVFGPQCNQIISYVLFLIVHQ